MSTLYEHMLMKAVSGPSESYKLLVHAALSVRLLFWAQEQDLQA